MADEAPDLEEEGTGEDASSEAELAEEPWRPPPAMLAPAGISRRTIGIALALVALVGIIVADVAFMLNTAGKRDPVVAVASASASTSASDGPESFDTESAAQAPVERGSAPQSSGEGELFLDESEEPQADQPQKPKPDQRASAGSVQDAAARSCSTSSVDGLSRQIIGQSRCIDPRAFVAVPRRPNLTTKSNVFLYLDASARDHLVKALDANRKKTMTVNSALRTVAQQYLLRRWSLRKRCGIELATPPGDSNHESGLALDIAEASAWRSALEAQEFRWLGSIDRVHFDYKGPDASSRASVDVKAFQQLWNRNHPDDKIAESGRYTPATEERLEKSPAKGFSRGPQCSK